MVPPPLETDLDERKKWTRLQCEYVLNGSKSLSYLLEKFSMSSSFIGSFQVYKEADDAISHLYDSREFDSEFASKSPLTTNTDRPTVSAVIATNTTHGGDLESEFASLVPFAESTAYNLEHHDGDNCSEGESM